MEKGVNIYARHCTKSCIKTIDKLLYSDYNCPNILHSGVGLFVGFELVKDRVTLTPATEEAALLVKR